MILVLRTSQDNQTKKISYPHFGSNTIYIQICEPYNVDEMQVPSLGAVSKSSAIYLRAQKLWNILTKQNCCLLFREMENDGKMETRNPFY